MLGSFASERLTRIDAMHMSRKSVPVSLHNSENEISAQTGAFHSEEASRVRSLDLTALTRRNVHAPQEPHAFTAPESSNRSNRSIREAEGHAFSSYEVATSSQLPLPSTPADMGTADVTDTIHWTVGTVFWTFGVFLLAGLAGDSGPSCSQAAMVT
jgi:hypothetical protein